jgi:hypothetical protein
MASSIVFFVLCSTLDAEFADNGFMVLPVVLWVSQTDFASIRTGVQHSCGLARRKWVEL